MERVFIIGLGRRALVHARLLSSRPDVAIMGGYDRSNKHKTQWHKFDKFQNFSDLGEGLKRVDPTVILIATPPQIRFQLFKYFSTLSSLKTIVIEKPFALSVQEGFSIAQECIDKGWNLWVGHQSRYCDEFIALKESIQEKNIGELVFIKSACYGNLYNQGTHAIDMIRWLTDNQAILWADATGNGKLETIRQLSPYCEDLELDKDHPGSLWSSITLRLQSGVDVLMTCGLLDARPIPSLGPWLQRRISAVGTEGLAETHLASYFKEISLHHPPKKYITSTDQYLCSLQKFHDQIFNNTKMCEEKRLNLIEDYLLTLGILKNIQISSEQNRLVKIPTSISELRAQNNKENKPINILSPTISVIIPMDTHRGLAEQAVTSWMQQRCESYKYEVILIFYTHQQDLKKSLESKLRHQDKAILVDAENEIALCHQGALIANGTYLLFTESHCIAEPETVQQAINFFKHEQEDAFYPRTEPMCKSTIGEMEYKYYQLGFSEFHKPDYWAKVTLHAFGIKKNVYVEVGGFEYRYNRFAYWLFGAKLHSKSYRIGYAPGVCVKHLFVENFALLNQFLQEIVVGECLYRIESNQDYCIKMFGCPEEWQLARNLNKDLQKLISGNVVSLISSSKFYLFKIDNYLRAFFYLIFGTISMRLKFQIEKIFNRSLYAVTRKKSDRAFKYYINYVQKLSACIRVHQALKLAKKEPLPLASDCYSLATIDECAIEGFHIPEHRQGMEFRWSKRISAVKIPFSTKHNYIRLKLLPVREIRYSDLVFFLNNKGIRSININQENTEISFPFPKIKKPFQDFFWLIIFARPWKKSRENDDLRELGLPIQEILLETKPI